MIGYKPDMKSLGKRSALNAHAAFDAAGAGNTIAWIGAPVLDPTCEKFRGETPLYLLDRLCHYRYRLIVCPARNTGNKYNQKNKSCFHKILLWLMNKT